MVFLVLNLVRFLQVGVFAGVFAGVFLWLFLGLLLGLLLGFCRPGWGQECGDLARLTLQLFSLSSARGQAGRCFNDSCHIIGWSQIEKMF